MPSVHIFGEKDPVTKGEGNLKNFTEENRVVIHHSGGHEIPYNGNYEKLMDFFDEQSHRDL